MRNLISVLCLLTAGLLSAVTLAGYQVDQLLRDEEPIRSIAGGLPEDEAFTEAVSELVFDEAVQTLPDGLAQFVPGGLETLLHPVIDSALDNERTAQAWDEVLQNTRSDYAAQLGELFERGTTGDPSELDLTVELTPVTDAMTQPLRDGIEDALGALPGLDPQSIQIPTATIEFDIETVTDESADPYTWATAAAVSQHWLIIAVAAAVLAGIGLLVGTPRTRWVGAAVGAAAAAGMGLWVALTAASPTWSYPEGLPQAGTVMLEHVQGQFTAWAQPAWWAFTGVAGFVVVVAVLAAVVTDARGEQ